LVFSSFKRTKKERGRTIEKKKKIIIFIRIQVRLPCYNSFIVKQIGMVPQFAELVNMKEKKEKGCKEGEKK